MIKAVSYAAYIVPVRIKDGKKKSASSCIFVGLIFCVRGWIMFACRNTLMRIVIYKMRPVWRM